MTGDTATGFPDFDRIEAHTPLPDLVDDISYVRVVMNAGTTWDYFAGHVDPEYARNHGHPTIFVNTMHTVGFVDRVATQWAGPCARVRRRRTALAVPVYAGDRITGSGRVLVKRSEIRGDTTEYLVELEVTVTNQHGQTCCTATLTLELTPPADASGRY